MAEARHGTCELMAQHGRGTAWARHGNSMLFMNQALMYLAWGVKQCDKLDAATPFTEIVSLLFSTALG